MNVRNQVLVSGGVIGVMFAVAGWAASRVPDQIAVHWNMEGRPDGHMERTAALVVVPAVAVILTGFFAVAPAVMPAASKLERSAAAWKADWIVVLIGLLLCQLLIVVANLGVQLDVPRCASIIAALMMLVVGNWLGKVRYNYIFGVRTPWTLANERVWDRTHRFAGRVMVLAALTLGAVCLLLPTFPQAGLVVTAAAILCASLPALAAVIYSAMITIPS